MRLRDVSVGAAVVAAIAAGGTVLVRQWAAHTPAGAAAALPTGTPAATAPGAASIPPSVPGKSPSAPAAPVQNEPHRLSPADAVRPPALSAPQTAEPVPPPAAPLTRAEKATLVAVRQVSALRSTVALWKLMHDGREPDFVKSPRWEQFVNTDEKGRTALERPPANPFNGNVAVLSVAGGTQPGRKLKGDGFGWVYDRATGKLWAIDSSGAVFDDAAVDVFALETRAVKDLSPQAARRSVGVLTQSLRSQIALYKLQHDDNAPDFARYPAWEQLRSRTTHDGALVPSAAAKGPRDSFYGPYVPFVPVNALNGRHKVAVVTGDVKAGQAVQGDFGYVFSNSAQRFYSLDGDGRVMPEPAPGAEWTGARSTDSSESRRSGASVLQTVRAQLMMYKLQHNDAEVDLARHPNWEQLTGRTRVDGTPDPAGPYGPYLAKAPVNWRNGSSAVEIVAKVPAGYRTSKKVGFVQDGASGRIWMVDDKGVIVVD